LTCTTTDRRRGLLTPRLSNAAHSFFSDIDSLAEVVGQGMEFGLPL